MTLQRRRPLVADPLAVAEWQHRSRRPLPPRRAGRRRKATVELGAELSPARWYAACLQQRGGVCAVPGCGEHHIEMDHLIPRSQGGPYVVQNGLSLCGPFSRALSGGHHLAKTQHRLLIRPEWLAADQIDWLALHGHAMWDQHGEVHGRHRRLFAPAQ